MPALPILLLLTVLTHDYSQSESGKTARIFTFTARLYAESTAMWQLDLASALAVWPMALTLHLCMRAIRHMGQSTSAVLGWSAVPSPCRCQVELPPRYLRKFTVGKPVHFIPRQVQVRNKAA